ncbi:MAG: GxxExxY protein [Chloroflexota bacterium]
MDELTHTAEKVSAGCIEIGRQLGHGMDTTVYSRALALEMQTRGVVFARDERVPVIYKERQIDSRRVDFVVDGLIVEVVSKDNLSADDLARYTSYLRASGYRMALVVNFGPAKVDVRNLVTQARPEEG